MASGMSDYLEAALLNYLFKGAAFTNPAGIFDIALYTATPSDTGGGTEVSSTGTAYVRKSTTAAQWTVSGTTPTQAANNADLVWAAATASWGNISGFALFQSTNPCFWGDLTNGPKTIGSGDIFQFSSGDLKVTLE